MRGVRGLGGPGRSGGWGGSGSGTDAGSRVPAAAAQVVVKIVEATLHAQSVHRGAAQIVPAARRATYASVLMGRPTLFEPVYLAEISCSPEAVGAVYTTVAQRRGTVLAESSSPSATIVRAHVPVAQSFGLAAALRQATGGKAFPSLAFDKWAKLDMGDPYDPASRANALCVAIRARKGVLNKGVTDAKSQLPALSDFLDRL